LVGRLAGLCWVGWMVSLLVGGVAGWWVVGSVNELVGCWFGWFIDCLVG